MTKLYDVPRNSRIKFEDGTELNFHHVDGAYSYCTLDDGTVVHLAAWEDVEVLNDANVRRVEKAVRNNQRSPRKSRGGVYGK